jgi:hypothetical protein
MLAVNDESFQLPRRLLDLEPRTVEWLARLNEEERQNLVYMGDLPVKKRERLERFLSLPEEEFHAGFEIVTAAVRTKWILKKGFYIGSSVAAALLIYSQIMAFIAKRGTGQ